MGYLGLGSFKSHPEYIDELYTPPTYTNSHSISTDGNSGSLVSIAKSAQIGTPFKPTSAITVSCWVKPNGGSWGLSTGDGTHAFVSSLLTGGFNIGMVNTGSNETSLAFQIGVVDNTLHGASGSPTRGYITATVDTDNTEGTNGGRNIGSSNGGWAHIICTYDGEYAKIYVNADNSTGVTNARLANTGVDIAYATNYDDQGVLKTWQVTRLAFGGNYFHGYNFNGLIDNVAMWDVALDQSNITKVYNSATPFDLRSNSGNYTQSANLIGYWNFEDALGTSTADLTGNAGTGTLEGGSSFSTTVIPN